jgi:hypothetical protein
MIKEINSNSMTISKFDNKIRVAKTYRQMPNGSIEVIIPKGLCEQYDLMEPTHVTMVPQDNGFLVTKLLFPVSEQDLKNNDK